jgi:predicted ribosome quality control (RQC) complex YloA/Tae2 family protein
MQNNFYFLRQLSQRLVGLLTGSQLVECYTQSKGELSLGFLQPGGQEYFLKGVFQPDFSCLYLPRQQQRARRNSVDLFGELENRTVTGIEQYSYDRSFSLLFEGDYSLLFKMHGNRANVILLHQQQPLRLFKSKLAKDWNLSPASLHRHPQPSFDAFIAAGENPVKVLPTLGQEALAFLKESGWDSAPAAEKWERLMALEKQLLHPQAYYVCLREGKPNLLLFAWGEPVFQSADPLEALAYFYRSYTHDWALQREKSSMLQQLDRRIKNTENYLYKTLEKLEELQTSASHRHLGDLLMANLHAIAPGSEKAEVLDFYTNKPVSIKLKRELSPQKNAEQFYRKAKNQQLELRHLEENLAAKEERLKELQQLHGQIAAEEDLKQLRKLRKEQLPEEDNQPSLPYRLFEVQQHQILVGKGSTQNDALLRYHSRKDDLWLHAKDVSGSHVIIRRQPGKTVPAPVKEKAAQLAAWYSKRKSDSLCPVICTARKWVRKLKGAPAGAVVVDKEEEVLLVVPRAFE